LVVAFDSVVVHVLAALLMATCWHQSAWVGHDALHNSIVNDRRMSHFIGMLYGNCTTGLSAGWWKYTHNMHHVVTNEWDKDPDIAHLPLFAVTEKMFLDGRAREPSHIESWLVSVLVPVQQFTYIPAMLLARVNLYVQSIVFVFGERVAVIDQPMAFDHDIRLYEKLGLIVFWSWYSLFVTTAFASWQRMALFVLCSHAYMAILHIQITLSHWDRPMALPEDSAHEWVRVQVTAARNINPNVFTDWFWGGLHYQIEHHLFPRAPRHSLCKLKTLVEPFCAKWNIDYTSTTATHALVDLMNSLGDVATKVPQGEQNKHSN